MIIDPGAEIFIGFFIALITYVLAKTGVELPICLGSMVTISFVLGTIFVLFSGQPETTLFTILINSTVFLLGNALGLIGAGLLETFLNFGKELLKF